tara:strand:+ start:250 stop:426 length:177 start_codon:yes stop_codon:yes gene_type:complete
VAQLGARVNGIHEVAGSIPAWSTTSFLARSILSEHPLDFSQVGGHGQSQHQQDPSLNR